MGRNIRRHCADQPSIPSRTDSDKKICTARKCAAISEAAARVMMAETLIAVPDDLRIVQPSDIVGRDVGLLKRAQQELFAGRYGRLAHHAARACSAKTGRLSQTL